MFSSTNTDKHFSRMRNSSFQRKERTHTAECPSLTLERMRDCVKALEGQVKKYKLYPTGL